MSKGRETLRDTSKGISLMCPPHKSRGFVNRKNSHSLDAQKKAPALGPELYK